MFQNRLKELREAAGYKSQQAFADAFGVAQSTVGGWESGKREPNHETTKKLARFFNVPVDYLLCAQSVINIYLNDTQQEYLYKIFIDACIAHDVTPSFAIMRAKVSYDFFPRLKEGVLHQASENDLLAVADYLGVKENVSQIIDKSYFSDSFSYAMHEETKDLPEETKQLLLLIAREFRGKREINDDDIKFALFGGDGEITDDMFDEVKNFAEFVKNREEQKKRKE